MRTIGEQSRSSAKYKIQQGTQKVKASDIQFVRTCEAFPEQYDALDLAGQIVGYVRVRWGWCTACCPDSESDSEVYSSKLFGEVGAFSSDDDRRKHLRRISRKIAAWCNSHPGAYGKS